MLRIIGVLCVCLWLMSCGSQPTVETREELEETLGIQRVNDVELKRSRLFRSDAEVLDIGISIFDVQQQNVGPAAVGDWIFDEILEIESQYLPSVLRDALAKSGYWGVVRVLPKNDPSIDIQIEGIIHESNGTYLDISFIARDSTGREWLNQRYAQFNDGSTPARQVGGAQMGGALGYGTYEDPFQSIYNQFANDLAQIFEMKSEAEIQNVQRITELTYANEMAPDTFAGTLSVDEEGYKRISRLLSDSDPVFARLSRMRLRHHVFIDTIDEYYAALQQDTQAVYDLWRVYSREQILEVETYERREDDAGERGYIAIANNWYRYKANRIFEQEWNELAEGFTSEVAPSILELNTQVYGLTGSVEDQYIQWRELLRQFYLQERGEL